MSMDEQMSKALGFIEAAVQTADQDSRSDLLTAIACIAICALRSVEHDQFVRGFLQGAIDELDQPNDIVFDFDVKRH